MLSCDLFRTSIYCKSSWEDIRFITRVYSTWTLYISSKFHVEIKYLASEKYVYSLKICLSIIVLKQKYLR